MTIQQSADSWRNTAARFLAGGIVTAVFSGSLVRLTSNVSLFEVLAVGLIVPSFTWLVQLAASSIFLGDQQRRNYHAALGSACLRGALALVPPALLNWYLPNPPFWISAVGVAVSVLIMAAHLFRRSTAQIISIWWPVSWCATIAANIALFLVVSQHWWIRATDALAMTHAAKWL